MSPLYRCFIASSRLAANFKTLVSPLILKSQGFVVQTLVHILARVRRVCPCQLLNYPPAIRQKCFNINVSDCAHQVPEVGCAFVSDIRCMCVCVPARPWSIRLRSCHGERKQLYQLHLELSDVRAASFSEACGRPGRYVTNPYKFKSA